MRGTAVLLPETGVQAVFGRVRALRHRHIEAAQSKIGRSDLDEQGLDRLDPGAQVVQSPEHQVPARKRCQRVLVHGLIIRAPRPPARRVIGIGRVTAVVQFGTATRAAPCYGEAMSIYRGLLSWSVAALVLAAGLSSSVQAEQILGRSRQAQQAVTATAEARYVAEQLYRTALGRDGDRAAVALAAQQIENGNLQRAVNTVVNSQDFRNTTARMRSADVLEQFYQGLHGRSPDPTGMSIFLPQLDRRAYAAVLTEMVESPEFMATVEREAGGLASGDSALAESVLVCHSNVVDAVSDVAPGRVLLNFEQPPQVAGNTRGISGTAVDESEGSRNLSYQCEGDRVTFTYADRRPARGADPRTQIGFPIIRTCLTRAADTLRDARVVAIGVSSTDVDSGHILVTGFSRAGAVHASCEVEGQQIVSVRRR